MNSPGWFEELPIADPPADRWEISLRPLSISVTEEGQEPWNPRILLVVEAGTGAVLGHRLLEPDADPDLVLDLVLSTMSAPAAGPPRRPRTIQTDTDQLLPYLKELSAQLNVAIEQALDLPELSYALHTFEEFVNLKPPLYLDEEDADPQCVSDFFHAAADFYRKEPWQALSDSEPITLFADHWEDAKYAVVMGQGNIVSGLALYDDAEDLEDLYMDETLDPTELECTAVTFGDLEELGEDQQEEIDEHGWEVASGEAIPLATRTDALGPPRTPSMEQLKNLELALKILPDIAKSLPKKESQREEVEPQPWEVQIDDQTLQGWWGYGIFYVDEMEGEGGGT